MADVTLKYRIGFALSRLPGVYRFLQWSNKRGVPLARYALASVAGALAPASSKRWGNARRSVSIYEALKSGSTAVEGRIVLHGQKPSPLPPNSMQERCGLWQHKRQPWPIFWSRHRNARLVGDSLGLLVDGKTLVTESVYGQMGVTTDPCNVNVRLPEVTRLEGPCTSIVSRWSPNTAPPNFSHWLLDCLPRLALLDEFPPDTKILVPGRLAKYQLETIEMLGLKDRIRFTPETNLEIGDYYFSSPVSLIVCDSPYAVDFLRAKFLPKADPAHGGPKRFIIDRKGKTRGLQNREEFNRFFENLGWAIINTEDLTFAQEVKLFSEAEAFAGAIGSGFTNAVWCKPGCVVLQVMPETVLDGSAEWICMHNRLNWKYQVCPSDPELRALVDLEETKRILAECGLL